MLALSIINMHGPLGLFPHSARILLARGTGALVRVVEEEGVIKGVKGLSLVSSKQRELSSPEGKKLHPSLGRRIQARVEPLFGRRRQIYVYCESFLKAEVRARGKACSTNIYKHAPHDLLSELYRKFRIGFFSSSSGLGGQKLISPLLLLLSRLPHTRWRWHLSFFGPSPTANAAKAS